MRVFLALEIPGEAKQYLGAVIRGLASRIRGVKWVNEEGQHITLKFFGDLEETRVSAIKNALQGVERQYGPITVTLKDIHAFPDRRRARVIVIALEKGVDNIQMIFHDIENRLSGLGIEKEKRSFQPHITLGRMRVPGPLLNRDIMPVEERNFTLDRIVLFQSTLTKEGAIYTPLWESKLE